VLNKNTMSVSSGGSDANDLAGGRRLQRRCIQTEATQTCRLAANCLMVVDYLEMSDRQSSLFAYNCFGLTAAVEEEKDDEYINGYSKYTVVDCCRCISCRSGLSLVSLCELLLCV
jgi:hypothetical protein